MKTPLPDEIRKPSKTLAGVTPVAVMCEPRKCKHGTCLYCPSLDVPQSYTPKSPPVLRAEALKYDPYEQVVSRLRAFEIMNHPTEKIELIIMGGNFLDYPADYQYNFVKRCYDALNRPGKSSRSLESAKRNNERTKHRCVALCIETRPDSITPESVKRLHDFGCTRVELGVQCLDDRVYKLVNRGHKVADVVMATRVLKNSGFKVGYHMMLGLPGSDKKKDFEMFRVLFKNQDFKPDQLKIYPCQVLKGSGLSGIYDKGKYKPYSKEEISGLIVKILKIIPNYCRVMRVMREIPPEFLVAGTTRIDLRRDIEEKLRLGKSSGKVKEIRFREIGFALRDLKPGQRINNELKLKVTKYPASEGVEYFLEIVNKDNILFALCRLRISKENGSGFVRELHVYGQSLNLGEKPGKSGVSQHSGLGRQLISEAENLCRKNKINQLKIISGAGVREYYRKLGYSLDLDRIYMEKRFF